MQTKKVVIRGIQMKREIMRVRKKITKELLTIQKVSLIKVKIYKQICLGHLIFKDIENKTLNFHHSKSLMK